MTGHAWIQVKRRSISWGNAPTDSMAYYGIPRPALLPARAPDRRYRTWSYNLTAQTIFGGAGNDIINFGRFPASLTAQVSGGGAATTKVGLSGTISDPNSIFGSQAILGTAIGSGGISGHRYSHLCRCYPTG